MTLLIILILLYPILNSIKINITYLELVGRARLTIYLFWKLQIVQFDIRLKGDFGVFFNGKEIDLSKLTSQKPILGADDIKKLLTAFGIKKASIGIAYAEEDLMQANLTFSVINYMVENVMYRLKSNGVVDEYRIYQKLSTQSGQNYISISGNVKVKILALLKVSIGTLKSYMKNRKTRKLAQKGELI